MLNMMKAEICDGCVFSKSWGCNRLVIPGGFGRNDRVASDYLKANDKQCKYREKL